MLREHPAQTLRVRDGIGIIPVNAKRFESVVDQEDHLCLDFEIIVKQGVRSSSRHELAVRLVTAVGEAFRDVGDTE